MTQKTKYLGATSALIMLLSVTVVQMDGSAFAMTSDYCQEIKAKIKSGELSEDEAKQLGEECNTGNKNQKEEQPSDREEYRTGEKEEKTTGEQRGEMSDREEYKTGEKPNTKEEKVGIPDGVRNNAGWWAAGGINDQEFISGIQYLVQQDIVQISDNVEQTTTLDDSEEIPTWVKNNAEWWSQHMISDDGFIKGIEYLVENGVIQV